MVRVAGGRLRRVCPVRGGTVASSQGRRGPMPSHQQAPSGACQRPAAAATKISSRPRRWSRRRASAATTTARERGNLSLQSFDVATAGEHTDTTEKMIRKLRAGQMPPAGSRRPDEAALDALADALEAQADARAGGAAPGRRTFQRLNRAEYTRSVRDLLGARRQRRRLPAARHQERQLRQHRRRAAAVADADAGAT